MLNLKIILVLVWNSLSENKTYKGYSRVLFLNQNICCGASTQKKCLRETVLLSTQNICKNWQVKK